MGTDKTLDARAAFADWAASQGLAGLIVDEYAFEQRTQLSWIRFRAENPERWAMRKKLDFDIVDMPPAELFHEFVSAWDEEDGWRVDYASA